MKGAPYILVSAFFFACMNLGVRLLKGSFTPDVLIFYRALFQVCLLLYWVRSFLPTSKQDARKKLNQHFTRGIFGVTSMLFLYASMQRLPIGIASLLTMSSIFWSALFSRLFLNETLTKKQLSWTLVAVLGIVIAVLRSTSTFNEPLDTFGVVAGLLAGAAAGSAYTVLRSIRKSVPTKEIVFYFGCLGVLITGPMAINHFKVPSSPRELFLLLGISASATMAQLFMTHGFKDTPATLASLINLQQTTFSVILGMVFLNEWPAFTFYVGAVLVFIGLRNLIVLQVKK